MLEKLLGAILGSNKEQYGLIGFPVDHSKSPLIHNTFAQLRGDNLEYRLILVTPEELEKTINKLCVNGVRGLNVTVPYKSKVIPYLAKISKEAEKIGAVNTLKLTEAGYVGVNTDVLGLRKSLLEKGVSIKDKDCVVLGAGGASRAVIAALIMDGAKSITVINRTYENAVSLCEDMNASFETDILKALPLAGIGDLPVNLYCFQCTSLGLHSDNALITDKNFYDKLLFGYDIVPRLSTDFLNRCQASGVECENGLAMLLYQAVAAYEFWNETEISKEDIETVKQKLYEDCKDNTNENTDN